MANQIQKSVTSTVIEACVGESALADRGRLILINKGPADCYYAYAEEDATPEKGMLMPPYMPFIWEVPLSWKGAGERPVDLPVHVYVACAAGETSTICIEEW